MKPAIAHRDASPSNDEQPTPDEVLSVEEAAVLLRIGRDTLYAEVAANRIPHRKLGKLIRFSRTASVQRGFSGRHRASVAHGADVAQDRRGGMRSYANPYRPYDFQLTLDHIVRILSS